MIMTSKLKVYLANISSAQQLALPYACGILRSYAEQNSFIKENVEWPTFIFHTLDGIEKVFEQIENPDVFGLSCYIWNYNRTKKLARLIKKKYPNCLIVLGGPSVPDYPKNFFKDFPEADILVHGEGEITFQKILCQHILGNTNWKEINGITFNCNNIGITTLPGEKLPKNIKYPSPYLLGYFKEHEKELEERGLPKLCILESNRGCPYSCTFCDWGSYVNQKVRLFDWDRLCEEIRYAGTRMDEVFIVDANFGILKRDVTIAEKIAEQVDKHKKIKTFHVTYAKNANDRVIEIAKILESRNLSRAGVTLSLQSNTEKVLEVIKRKNIPIENYRYLQKKLNAEGISHYSDIIIGLPEETLDTLLDSTEMILEGNPSDIKFHALTLLPNAEINNKITKNHYKFETQVVKIFNGIEEDECEYMEQLIGTKDMPKEQMTWALKWREAIEYLHFGKWTYFIAEYLKKNKNLRYVDFYKGLVENAFENKETILGKCVKSWYIKNWNSGSFINFEGPISPHEIDWQNLFFYKHTFHWLCISVDRKQFYIELEQYLREKIGWDNEFEDLFRFQKEAMIEFNFDISQNKKLHYNYNWFEFFHNNKTLTANKNSIIYKTTHVGRYNIPLKPNNPESFFHVAGGYLYYFQKMNAFFHRAAEIYYRDNNIAVTFQPNFSTGNPIKSSV